ncbi:MAG: hypothetical protein B7Y50_07285 [Hydrogenophilales bacterium 28-61-11]|nr:MAG: hypothetical protein B7Y50_07285 [Hydrogenophilales bacterium 28-61-11]
MLPALRVPFGLKDEVLYESRQVPNGKACGCICPACQRSLIARQNHQTPHFAHAPGEDCAKALETAVHLAAKQIIAERLELRLPVLAYINPYARPLYGVPSQPQTVYVEHTVKLDTVAVEYGLGDMRPDIIVTVNGSNTYLVEIAVTHFVDDAKQAKINQRQLHAIEIDISRLKGQVTFAGLAELFFRTKPYPAKWLYHPRLEELRRADWEEDQITKSIAALEQQEREAELAEAEARFRKYREMPPAAKLALNCRKLGLTKDQIQKLTTFVPWEKSLGAPRVVWQSAVLVYRARVQQEQTQIVEISYPSAFYPKECLEWLALGFAIDYGDDENTKYAVAFWKYIHFLTAIGVLTKDHSGNYEITIPPDYWRNMRRNRTTPCNEGIGRDGLPDSHPEIEPPKLLTHRWGAERAPSPVGPPPRHFWPTPRVP